MKVTTVRLRPMRRKTVEEAGVDLASITGQGAELWVGGELWAVLSIDEEGGCEIVWGTEQAAAREREIADLTRHAAELMRDAKREEVPA